jgi:hypothetical protein
MPKFWSTIATAGVASLFAVSQAAAATCSEANSIARIHNRAPAGPYEYVIFDFVKPPKLPKFTVKTAHPPFIQDPSGNPVTVAGKKFKEVQFREVAWMCTINETLNLPKPAIKGIKSTGQFEGVITYVIGIRSASRFDGSYSYDAGPVTKIVVRVRK